MPTLLDVRNLRMHFPVRGRLFRKTPPPCKSVDGVSLSIAPGETLGLVGESGCGKSTLGKVIAGLHRPTSGEVSLNGVPVHNLSDSRRLPFRRYVQMIFQDPSESLNQRHTVSEIIEEPFLIHRLGDRAERRKWTLELLDKVGLPSGSADKFPFEFSGGQRQRIGIARAVALKPKLVICDEPVSALDVSIQGQVLNLLLDLQRDMGLSYLFIAHDLAVVKHMSDRVAVMYLGKIMETGPSDEVYREPLHAYTKALISAMPSHAGEDRKRRILIGGEPPSPLNPPPGCAFGHRNSHPRHPESVASEPQFREVKPGRFVYDCACCRD